MFIALFIFCLVSRQFLNTQVFVIFSFVSGVVLILIGNLWKKRRGEVVKGQEISKICLFLILLWINAWQFSQLSAQANKQESKELILENIIIYGEISRDGILNASGKPVNYIQSSMIEYSSGTRFSMESEFAIYGTKERFYRGHSAQAIISGSVQKLPRDSFIRSGIDFSANGELVVDIAENSQNPHTLHANQQKVRARWRSQLDKRLEELSPQSKSYIQSLILGYRSELAGGLQDLFRNSGVIHILVLSGMHIGIIYLSIKLLIPPFVPVFMKEISAILIMGLYLWFINPGASLWRAVVMLVLWTVLRWMAWKVSGDSVLSIVWTVLILVNARFIFDTGMYLSFLAIWGLMNHGEPIKVLIGKIAYAQRAILSTLTKSISVRRRKGVGNSVLPEKGIRIQKPMRRKILAFRSIIYQKLLNIFLPSLSAQSAILPVSFLLFDSISPQGLIALVFVIPLFYLSLLVSALIIPLSFAIPELAIIFGNILDWIIQAMVAVLFPFASFASEIQSLPLPFRVCIAFAPILILITCRYTSTLLISNNVQLFFNQRDTRTPRKA